MDSIREPEPQSNSSPFCGYVFSPWILNSPELAANVSLRGAFQLRALLEPVKGHGRDAALEDKLLRVQYQGLCGGWEWMRSVQLNCDGPDMFLPGKFAREQHTGVYTDLQSAANSFQILVASSCPGERGDSSEKLRPCVFHAVENTSLVPDIQVSFPHP